jgi:2-keto-4-pentenoate hydratase/2-oxohepta-3-ene-1,7-dioic acid hydratase in catechol pathway
MKIGIIQGHNGPTLAAIYGDSWVSIPEALEALGEIPVNEMAQFIDTYCDTVVEINEKIRALVASHGTEAYPLADAIFLPPLPAVPKLFTARGNSAVFTRVIKSKVCKQPVMEQRYNFNLVGHKHKMVVRDGFKGTGWNYEMVAVMGKPCHGVPEEQVEKYIFGYTNMLDHGGGYCGPFDEKWDMPEEEKWTMPEEDKVFADYAYAGCYNGNTQVPTPIGPYITTKDEVGDPHDQLLEERESGRLVSLGSGKAVVFTINEMVSYASGFMTLYPGDMMSTASITYDAYQSFPGPWPENAYVQVKTEKLGTLRVRIKEERKEFCV